MTSELQALPPNWDSENVSQIACRRIEIEAGEAWLLKLVSDENTDFWGIRPGRGIGVAPGSTARLAVTTDIVSHENAATMHLVLREWSTAGAFQYQVQKEVVVDAQQSLFEVFLTVRDAGHFVQPVFLVGRSQPGRSCVEVRFDNVSLKIV